MTRRRPRGRRSWPQRLLLVTNCLLVVACLGAAFGFSYFKRKFDAFDVVSAGVSLAPEIGSEEPRNILIIGTDYADRLAKDDPVRKGRDTGERLADVIMILRLDPKAGTAHLISIPRDTYLPISPYGTKQRINAAIYGPDGPQHLIQTIKDNFAISIDNYVEIDFAGFRGLVEILDGVPVYLTAPVRDRRTGLYQPEAGCVTLDPLQALAYTRSRHFQYKKDGKWVDDPTGDLGRISRQQDFIKRALKRAIDKGARNPATALSLLTAAASAITIDETLTVGDMRDLVTRFRDFNVDSLQSNQVPTRAAPIGGAAYQAVDWDEAWPLLTPFWGAAEGSELGPRDLIVTVTRSNGALSADQVVAQLEQHRFDADESSSAKGRARGTNIAFGSNGRDAAHELARWLDADDLTYTFDPTLPGRRVVLTPGDGLRGVRAEPVAADAVAEPPAASLPPTSRPGTTRSTTEPTEQPSEAPAATTTTVPGVVPTDPDAALRCSASG